jgi:tetratricopeptide (TPR) repeat protein
MAQSINDWESAMPRPGEASASSAVALASGAQPTPPKLAAGALGEAGSRDALARLNLAIVELKALKVQQTLQSAINALNGGDVKAGGEWAIKALEQDERSGLGWYLLAIARERAGDFGGSITCYEQALKLLPDHSEVANDLGRLAFRMGMKDQAEKLFRHFLARDPRNVEAANNLACAVRDLGRHSEAVDGLKPVLMANPEAAILWNTMGSIVSEQGDLATAMVFFEEALRLQPAFPKARYNLSNLKLVTGDPEGALADCDKALAGIVSEDERQMMLLARATMLMVLGRLGEGWDVYEARLHTHFADVTHFLIDQPRWAPEDDLAGKRLLVLGEQGLGDEVLFANLLPDVVDALGPDGRLSLAVEPRLVPLFQRSFPDAAVGPHATYLANGRTYRVAPFIGEGADIDLHTPLGSLLRRFRRDVADFPTRERFLTPDPARVAHWKAQLATAPAGPKVGILWKSMVKDGGRERFFSPFDRWATVLGTPGVTFVNLQYGDCAAELAAARDQLGVDIWTPPGIDLKQDLDDLAALACALDLVLGFSNATLNLAAACGAPTWLITNPGAWPRLGSDRYPWYPQARVFAPEQPGQWDPVMAAVARDLTAFAAGQEHGA